MVWFDWCVLNHILPFNSNHSKCFIVKLGDPLSSGLLELHTNRNQHRRSQASICVQNPRSIQKQKPGRKSWATSAALTFERCRSRNLQSQVTVDGRQHLQEDFQGMALSAPAPVSPFPKFSLFSVSALNYPTCG